MKRYIISLFVCLSLFSCNAGDPDGWNHSSPDRLMYKNAQKSLSSTVETLTTVFRVERLLSLEDATEYKLFLLKYFGNDGLTIGEDGSIVVRRQYLIKTSNKSLSEGGKWLIYPCKDVEIVMQKRDENLYGYSQSCISHWDYEYDSLKYLPYSTLYTEQVLDVYRTENDENPTAFYFSGKGTITVKGETDFVIDFDARNYHSSQLEGKLVLETTYCGYPERLTVTYPVGGEQPQFDYEMQK